MPTIQIRRQESVCTFVTANQHRCTIDFRRWRNMRRITDVVVPASTVYVLGPRPGVDPSRHKEHNLTRIVVASCSPLMHEPTFRGALVRQASTRSSADGHIREHVSGCTRTKRKPLPRRKDLVRAAVRRVRLHKPLEKRRSRSSPRCWWWAEESLVFMRP